MKNASPPIARRRLTDDIIERLIAMISSGEMKAGDRLPPEPELMKQFGVGRSSLREAINALSLTGLLSVSQGRGTYLATSADQIPVRPLKWGALLAQQSRIKEIVEARAALELSIVDLAVINATADDIAEIRRHIGELAAGDKSKRERIDADLAFHRALAQASHNSILIGFFEELRTPISAWMEQKSRIPWSYEDVYQQHSRILKAIEERNAEKARASLREHIQAAGEHLAESLLAQENSLSSAQTNPK